MKKRTISLVVNLDSRKGFLEDDTYTGPAGGTKSLEYFTAGLRHKVLALKQFENYDVETIVSIDWHEPLPDSILDSLLDYIKQGHISCLSFNQHKELLEGVYNPKWLDFAILNALFMARHEYVIHVDQDTCMVFKDNSILEEWFSYLDDGLFDYVSYPSIYSPDPVIDDGFKGEYFWASTRFFMCKRSILDYTEISKCLRSSEYLYGKYGAKRKQCPWLEHVLGIQAGNGRVFYPPQDYRKALIFCWSSYYKGLYARIHDMTFEQLRGLILVHGGIQYPCDVSLPK